MKLLDSVLVIAATVEANGNHYGHGNVPINNLVRRLENLKTWGDDCASRLQPPVKNNVLKKLNAMAGKATKFYNKNNGDLDDLEVIEWDDAKDRAINTENPCQCLYYVGKGYFNFFTRGFDGYNGRPRPEVKRIWEKLQWRLKKTYSCEFEYSNPNPYPKPTKGPKPTEKPKPKPTPKPTEKPKPKPTPKPTEKPTYPPNPKPACPAGWDTFADDGRCFQTKCGSRGIPWSVAQNRCFAEKAELAQILTEVQNKAVAATGEVGGPGLKGGIWIGGNDFEHEGTWLFRTGAALPFFNWAANQPDDGNDKITQDCIWMNFQERGVWDDLLCTATKAHCWACTKDPEGV